jgi:dephospho-CoA kinase
MFKVGLTGNYYSGQHEISKIFEEYNIPVFDGNLITKYLINYSDKHIKLIQGAFGSDIYSMGLLNLSKVSTNNKIDMIFDIIEFDLLKAFELFRIKHKDKVYSIFYFDQLFERGLNKLMNYNITCYRPKSYRKSDMQIFTEFDSYTIQKILNNEIDELFKNKESDYIIQNYNQNTGYQSDVVIGLEKRVKEVHQKIMSKKLSSIVERQYGL